MCVKNTISWHNSSHTSEKPVWQEFHVFEEYSPRDGIHTAVNCHYQAQPGRSKQIFLQSSIVSGQKVGRNRNENAGKGILCEFYKNT